MEYQNITLSIPKDILRKVKHIAIEKHTSISGFLAMVLEGIVRKEDLYNERRKHHLTILQSPPDLGTCGNIAWARGDLHERQR